MPELQVPAPPPELFVREHRQETTGEVVPLYPLEKIECLAGKGILVYRVDALYPEKGWPQPAQIYALNQVKRIIVEFAGLCSNPLIALGVLFTDKNRLMERFSSLFDKLYETYTIKEEFLCDASRYFYKFLSSFLTDCGFNPEISKAFSLRVAQVVEGDNRYRYRLQDIAGEYRGGSRQEVTRLFNLYVEREDSKGFIALKVGKIINLVELFLLIPKYEKAFIKNSYLIKHMALDDGDYYWANQGGGDTKPQGNYNFKGLSWEERRIPQVPKTYAAI